MAPSWERATSQIIESPQREPRFSPRLLVGFAAFVVGALAGIVAITFVGGGTVDDAAQPNDEATVIVPSTTPTSDAPAADEALPTLTIDAPDGRFYTNHLRAYITGTVTNATMVTVDGRAATLLPSESGVTRFELEDWLPSGESTLTIEASNEHGTASTILEVVSLPQLGAAQVGYLVGFPQAIAKTISFDPGQAVDTGGQPYREASPDNWLLRNEPEPEPANWAVANEQVDPVELRVDALAVVLIRTDSGWNTTTYEELKRMWNDPQLEAELRATPIWVSSSTVPGADSPPVVDQIYVDLRS